MFPAGLPIIHTGVKKEGKSWQMTAWEDDGQIVDIDRSMVDQKEKNKK